MRETRTRYWRGVRKRSWLPIPLSPTRSPPRYHSSWKRKVAERSWRAGLGPRSSSPCRKAPPSSGRLTPAPEPPLPSSRRRWSPASSPRRGSPPIPTCSRPSSLPLSSTRPRSLPSSIPHPETPCRGWPPELRPRRRPMTHCLEPPPSWKVRGCSRGRDLDSSVSAWQRRRGRAAAPSRGCLWALRQREERPRKPLPPAPRIGEGPRRQIPRHAEA